MTGLTTIANAVYVSLILLILTVVDDAYREPNQQ